jgi:peptidoglycan/xylan/chitin deacetylase (PgdA/CDA1 family)
MLGFRRWQGIVNRARGLRRSRILMYHSFTPGGWRYIERSILRKQLEVVSASYEIVPLQRLVDDLACGRSTDRSVAVTIDDAYEDFFEIAYPILEELHLPATLFVPTGYIGKHNDWEAQPPVRLNVMSGSQLRELDPAVVTIGSHSVRHRVLAGLTRQAVEREVRQSREQLQELLGRPVTLFAYPFGELATYTMQTQEVLRETGYRAAVSTRSGTYGSAKGLYELRRIELHGGDSPAEMLSRLAGDWDWRAGRELANYAFTRGRPSAR